MPDNINSTVGRARAAGMPSTGFPWRLLVVSIIIFGLMILIWAGISFGYIPYLNSQISSIDSAFNSLSSQIDTNQQKDLAQFYSQLYNIQTLSNTHSYSSKLFDFLEKDIYPTVKINNAQVDMSSGSLSIDGTATDYATLINQLAILKADPDIASVSLDSSKQNSSKEGNGVLFSIKLIFNGKFFYQPPKQ